MHSLKRAWIRFTFSATRMRVGIVVLAGRGDILFPYTVNRNSSDPSIGIAFTPALTISENEPYDCRKISPP